MRTIRVVYVTVDEQERITLQISNIKPDRQKITSFLGLGAASYRSWPRKGILEADKIQRRQTQVHSRMSPEMAAAEGQPIAKLRATSSNLYAGLSVIHLPPNELMRECLFGPDASRGNAIIIFEFEEYL